MEEEHVVMKSMKEIRNKLVKERRAIVLSIVRGEQQGEEYQKRLDSLVRTQERIGSLDRAMEDEKTLEGPIGIRAV